MQVLTGPTLVAAALLVLAGATKIVRPRPTTSALRGVGLTWIRDAHIRVLVVGEILIGLAALVRGGVGPAIAVSLAYLAFSAFLVLALRRRDRGSTCGCTGRTDSPPTVSHLVLTVMLGVLAAAAAASGGSTGLTDPLFFDPAMTGAALLVFVAVGTWLAWVVLIDLSTLTQRRIEEVA